MSTAIELKLENSNFHALIDSNDYDEVVPYKWYYKMHKQKNYMVNLQKLILMSDI
jgi:hypothetical protein